MDSRSLTYLTTGPVPCRADLINILIGGSLISHMIDKGSTPNSVCLNELSCIWLKQFRAGFQSQFSFEDFRVSVERFYNAALDPNFPVEWVAASAHISQWKASLDAIVTFDAQSCTPNWAGVKNFNQLYTEFLSIVEPVLKPLYPNLSSFKTTFEMLVHSSRSMVSITAGMLSDQTSPSLTNLTYEEVFTGLNNFFSDAGASEVKMTQSFDGPYSGIWNDLATVLSSGQALSMMVSTFEGNYDSEVPYFPTTPIQARDIVWMDEYQDYEWPNIVTALTNLTEQPIITNKSSNDFLGAARAYLETVNAAKSTYGERRAKPYWDSIKGLPAKYATLHTAALAYIAEIQKVTTVPNLDLFSKLAANLKFSESLENNPKKKEHPYSFGAREQLLGGQLTKEQFLEPLVEKITPQAAKIPSLVTYPTIWEDFTTIYHHGSLFASCLSNLNDKTLMPIDFLGLAYWMGTPKDGLIDRYLDDLTQAFANVKANLASIPVWAVPVITAQDETKEALAKIKALTGYARYEAETYQTPDMDISAYLQPALDCILKNAIGSKGSAFLGDPNFIKLMEQVTLHDFLYATADPSFLPGKSNLLLTPDQYEAVNNDVLKPKALEATIRSYFPKKVNETHILDSQHYPRMYDDIATVVTLGQNIRDIFSTYKNGAGNAPYFPDSRVRNDCIVWLEYEFMVNIGCLETACKDLLVGPTVANGAQAEFLAAITDVQNGIKTIKANAQQKNPLSEPFWSIQSNFDFIDTFETAKTAVKSYLTATLGSLPDIYDHFQILAASLGYTGYVMHSTEDRWLKSRKILVGDQIQSGTTKKALMTVASPSPDHGEIPIFEMGYDGMWNDLTYIYYYGSILSKVVTIINDPATPQEVNNDLALWMASSDNGFAEMYMKKFAAALANIRTNTAHIPVWAVALISFEDIKGPIITKFADSSTPGRNDPTYYQSSDFNNIPELLKNSLEKISARAFWSNASGPVVAEPLGVMLEQMMFNEYLSYHAHSVATGQKQDVPPDCFLTLEEPLLEASAMFHLIRGIFPESL